MIMLMSSFARAVGVGVLAFGRWGVGALGRWGAGALALGRGVFSPSTARGEMKA